MPAPLTVTVAVLNTICEHYEGQLTPQAWAAQGELIEALGKFVAHLNPKPTKEQPDG